MLKVLKKRERFFLYLALFLILSSLSFNSIIFPFWQKNQELNNEITRTRLRLIKYLEVLNRKDSLESDYAQDLPILKALEQKQDTLVTILSEIERLSQKANIKILDIRPQGINRSSETKALLFDLKLEGNIEGYLKFIYEIENSIFLLEAKKFLLRGKTDSNLIEATFTIAQTSRP